jgi:hypothetical protein
VKKRISLLILGLTLAWAPLSAEYDLADTGTQNILRESSPGQFSINGHGDWVMKAEHRNDDYHGHITYNHQEASFNAVIWYNECHKEGLRAGLVYERTYLHWNDNPFFTRKIYDTAAFSLAYFTHRVPDWRWIFQATWNVDADKWNLSLYSDYDLVLWGRYRYCPNVGLHFGLYAQTGMKLDQVYPILGFDWVINCNWKLNAVFPLDISLVYTWNDAWSFALAGRIFNDRHRAGNEGGFRKAVWRYTNAGGEFAITRNWCRWLRTNIHAGYTFGGKLKVANQHSHHSHRFKFKSSAYYGFEATAEF